MKQVLLIPKEKRQNLKAALVEFFEVNKENDCLETRKRNIAAKDAYHSVLKRYVEM